MRSLSVQGMQRIYHLRMEEAIPAPPLIDKMFGAGFPYWQWHQCYQSLCNVAQELGTIFWPDGAPLLSRIPKNGNNPWMLGSWMLTLVILGVNYRCLLRTKHNGKVVVGREGSRCSMGNEDMKAVEKEQASCCFTADVCLCQSVNQLYNNQKWPILLFFPLLEDMGSVDGIVSLPLPPVKSYLASETPYAQHTPTDRDPH